MGDMLKISDVVTLSNINYSEDGLKILKELMKSDINVEKTLKNIPEEVIRENLSTILSYLETQKICSTCTSLDNCESPFDGHTPKFEYVDGRFITSTKQCKYFNTFDEVNKKISAYLYDTLDGKYASITKQDLDISDEDRNNFLLNAKKYAESTSCYIYGEPSIGKTYIAYVLANSYVNKYENKKIVFAKVSTLMRHLKEHIPNQSLSAFIDKIKKADFVVFDDIGSKKLTDWEGQQMLELLELFGDTSHLIFTSNYSLAQLESRICTNKVQATKIIDKIKKIVEEVEIKGQRRS